MINKSTRCVWKRDMDPTHNKVKLIHLSMWVIVKPKSYFKECLEYFKISGNTNMAYDHNAKLHFHNLPFLIKKKELRK